MKKITNIIAVLLILTILIFFAKNFIIKTVVVKGVKAVTGLDLSMKSMDVGILRTFVYINGLKLYNPAGFPDRLMADMPEIYLDYDLPTLIKGKAHFREMRLNTREVLVVRNKKGRLNLNSLKVMKPEKQKGSSGKKKGMPEIRIDLLKLKVGKVIFKDYSTGFPIVTEFDVNIDAEYRNVSNAYDFVGLVVWNSLKDTDIPRLTDFDLNALKKYTSEFLKKSSDITKEVTRDALKVGKEIEKEAKEWLKIIPRIGDKSGSE